MTPRAITNRGWAWLVISGFSLLFGVSAGWAELIALGAAGLVTFGVASLYALFTHAHEVSFHLDHHRVTVGQDAALTVRVTNPTSRSLPGLDIFIPLEAEQISCEVNRLRRGQHEDIALPIPTAHRGVLTVGPARVVRQDPLGLISREVTHGEPTTLFVHPLTVGLASLSTGFVRDLEGNPTTDLTDNDLSFHALREYLPGDDRRNIHWKSTAKTGQFMVRQYEQTRRSHLMIGLDCDPAAYGVVGESEYELAVSAAASIGVRAIRDTREISVWVSAVARPPQLRGLSALRATALELGREKVLRRGDRSAPVARIRSLSTLSRDRLLDQLSDVHATEGSPSIVLLSRQASQNASDVSIAFLVTGALVDLRTLHSAANAFPQGVEVVVISCAPEAPPTMKRLGRLSVATIGRLDDLQQLMAKRVAL